MVTLPVVSPANHHVTEPGVYYLETVAVGIEIALMVTFDRDTALFLMKKFQAAILANEIEVELSLDETRKYLDYLDIIESPRNKDLRMEISRYKYI
jgi:hypothetical protein